MREGKRNRKLGIEEGKKEMDNEKIMEKEERRRMKKEKDEER